MTLIPSRELGAISGSEFINLNMSVKIDVREKNILNAFLAGNIPDFMRNFSPITLSLNGNTITYLATPDYLSIGSDSDYVIMPMNPLTAQKIADKYDCSLPTSKMVMDIWQHAANKLDANKLTWGPPYDASMMNTDRIKIHNDRINKLMVGLDNTKLTAGHKKDVVLTNKISPNNPNKRVVIFGWIKSDGKPIQGLNYWSHEDTYADYSHGIRLVANDVMVNGKPMRIQDVFKDATLSYLISDEDVLIFQRY